MKRTLLPRLLATVLLAIATGCISVGTPRFLMSAPERDWAPTLNQARELARIGSIGKADSVLARYAAIYPDSPQAVETHYWRSLLSLQESGGSQTVGSAVQMLRTYLAARSIERRLEADALLIAAIRVDTLSRMAASLSSRVMSSDGEVVSANARIADAKAATADAKDQESEIRRLKDELAKSKDELERIKKRLAEPPKKPPRR